MYAPDDDLTYGLDEDERIDEVSNTGGTLATYSYDRMGCRKTKTIDAVVTSFVYDLFGNVICEYEGQEWARDYVYGAKGELIYTRVPRMAAMDLEHDNLFHFITAWLCWPSCTQDDLMWDVNSDDQINLIDWTANVDSFDTAFTINSRFILTDFRNSVVGKVNFGGSVDEIAYTAFGELVVSQGTNLEGLAILWNGYYFDYETGNYYLRNRY